MNNGFDRIAFFYDRLAKLVFGKAMVQSQLTFLNRLSTCHSVLVLGGGTGWWIPDLIKINPNIQITFIDSSAKMISLAKEKAKSNKSIQFIVGTHEQLPIDKKYDAVVLFYFLDLFDRKSVPQVITTIKQSLNKKAIWLVTDFVEERKWHTLLLKIMYRCFYFTTGLKTKSLPDWRKYLNDSTLKETDRKALFGNFIRASVWE